MQNPEVLSFHEPEPVFRLTEHKSLEQSFKHADQFHFSHLVSVIFPNALVLPMDLVSVLTDDCDYYKVFDLNLGDLLIPSFLSTFVPLGSFTLLSIGTRIDIDDCAAVTPNGLLVLSLTKDTYQNSGLEGKKSHFSKNAMDRYIVKIDLRNSTLKEEKSFYKGTKKSLELLGKFTVILSWQPPDEDICPSSVAKFFNDLNYKVELCKPEFKTHIVYSVLAPKISNTSIDKDEIVDFIEWLGMISVDEDFSENVDDYVNSYEVPIPNSEMGQVRCLQWRGFYQSHQINGLLNFIKESCSRNEDLWTSVYVQGFSDAPVVEGDREHQYFTSGDSANLYVVRKSNILCCTMRSSGKRYK